MKKLIVLITLLICFDHPAWANELVEFRNRKAQAINQMNLEFNGQCSQGSGTFLSAFPASHPAGAFSGSATYMDSTFDLYLWEETGDIYLEIVPTSGAPFICGPGFAVIQDGIQNNDIYLDDPGGSGFCSYTYVPTVMKLTTWSFSSLTIDPKKEFTLVYDTVHYISTYEVKQVFETFNVPVLSGSSIDFPVNSGGCSTCPDCTVIISETDLSFTLENAVVESYPNARFDLKFEYSSSQNGYLLWELKDVVFKDDFVADCPSCPDCSVTIEYGLSFKLTDIKLGAYSGWLEFDYFGSVGDAVFVSLKNYSLK